MINRVTLVGRLGQDAELRYTTNGTAVSNFSVATTNTWVKDGEKQEKTEWHKVVVFGKSAEFAGEYVRKGSLVYIEGRLQTRSWEDKEGNKRYTTEVVAQTLRLLDSRRERGETAEREEEPYTSPNDESDVPF